MDRADDADSIYSADTAAPPSRAMDEPFGIVLTGTDGKLVDDALDVIDAEEMSSEEEAVSASMSDRSEVLTDTEEASLDPISDDDGTQNLREVSISDDTPQPTKVTAHTSLVTSSSSDTRVAQEKLALDNLVAPTNNTKCADTDGSEKPRPDVKMFDNDDDDFYDIDTHLEDEVVEDDDDDLPPRSLIMPKSRTANKLDTPAESMHSRASQSSASQSEEKRTSDAKPADMQTKKSSGSGGFGVFAFASSTFYRAFKKPSKPKAKKKENSRVRVLGSDDENEDENEGEIRVSLEDGTGNRERKESLQSAREGSSPSTPRSSRAYAEVDEPVDERSEEEKVEVDRHLRLEQTLKSQIATLRSARSGFVDLALLTPMTENTLAAVEGEATRILSELPEVERRTEEVARKVEVLELSTEAELSAKEQILVMSKMKLVEARCDLQSLKHEVLRLRKTMASPNLSAAAERMRISSRREKVEKELRATVESRDTMRRNVDMRQGILKRYQSEVQRLEKSVKDLEGEWE